MSHTIIVERDVETPMRDGVLLRSDVYRPENAGPLPVLLQRTPYGKSWSQVSFALMAVERGYTVVIQDTRGRWASDGKHYPMVGEMDDGYDTVEWAAGQPWSNGRVGMYGSSYVAYTQWAAAAAQPPALKTIIPTTGFCNPYEMLYAGGALALGTAVSWGLLSGAQMEILRFGGSEQDKARLWAQFIRAVDGMAQGETFEHFPLEEMPLIGKDGISAFFIDLLDHPTYDEYWQQVACRYDKINIPAFLVGGWYDIFLTSTLKDFTGLRERSPNDWVRSKQKLMIGPWIHGSYEGLSGEIDFGLQASYIVAAPEEAQLDWFDYWLKGISNGIEDEPPVRIFVMGENRWRYESEWPLERTRYTPYYLHSGGAANSVHGNGSLSPEMPGEEAADSFVYDPGNPVPTRGGGLCCWPAALPSGPFDQRSVEERPDVLVYTTPPLEQAVEVSGPIQVNLWATSSAPCTDFTAKLVDVGPCGYARNLQDGILRVSPGTDCEVNSYTIDIGATCNVFKAGHCIRLEISSSNFPRFNRNPNTGQTASGSAELHPALQTVLHDTGHPSHIVLPIIPREA